MYNVSQAARYSGVSGTTIRGWTREYSEYLSSTANPPAGQARQFVEDDLRVFATVATMRAQLVSTEDIRAALDTGQRIESMPPEVERPDQGDRAGDAPNVEAHAAAAAAAASTAIDIYRSRVTALETRADQLADRLIDAERRAAAAESAIEVHRDKVTALEARADQLADQARADQARADQLAGQAAADAARAAAAERELEVMRQLYEAATSPAPADRRPTFWQWLTGRRA